MLTHEQQLMWQKAEALLTSHLEGALEALVAACDAANPTLENATGGLLQAGTQCETYLKALERARGHLTGLKDHRRKFAEAKSAEEQPRRNEAVVHRQQTFQSILNGTNWRDMKGGRR